MILHWVKPEKVLAKDEWTELFGEQPIAVTVPTLLNRNVPTLTEWKARLVRGDYLRIEIQKYIVRGVTAPSTYRKEHLGKLYITISMDDIPSKWFGSYIDSRVIIKAPSLILTFEELEEIYSAIDEAKKVLMHIKWR